MMPPVSLPLNGGTQSARAGATDSIPQTATRHAANFLRIADSISPGSNIEGVGAHGKNEPAAGSVVLRRCCRTALDLAGASRHRLARWIIGWIPMRKLLISPRTLGLGAAVVLSLLS